MLLFFSCSIFPSVSSPLKADSHVRETPLVRAVANCKEAVVNLRGRKTVRDEENLTSTDALKQVNGMGTGVIIDSRGYILTNYHVVQGVSKIQVTTSSREKAIGRLVAHDPETDLAILKIETSQPLPTIEVGTSSDLMLAETVAAVGNAYGYEHTVTVGIISQLGRTVQVNDEQVYRNLIQTDAPINPGNSGGPLLNLEGKMIAINVAVRIGAQGIAFAIPVDEAMEVASRLMSQIVSQEITVGFETTTVFENDQPQVIVQSVDPGGPADGAGIAQGDRIITINGQSASRSIDLPRALLGSHASDELELEVEHAGVARQLALRIESNASEGSSVSWIPLGLKLVPVSEAEMANRHPNYKRGLRITKVRSGSPAELEGIMEGDILVAMHGWKTETLQNLAYILDQPDIKQNKDFMFYILREKEPFWGQMRVASKIGTDSHR